MVRQLVEPDSGCYVVNVRCIFDFEVRQVFWETFETRDWNERSRDRSYSYRENSRNIPTMEERNYVRTSNAISCKLQ